MGSSSSGVSIDVSTDLASTSALKAMLSSQHGAIFQIVGELEKFALQPIKAAAVAKASASVNLTDTASWKTSNGISFSLTPTAKCSINIGSASETFAVAMSIESTDPKDTKNVSAGPADGIVYVNIDLDFSIQGSVSGSGTFSGVGVAGKASGSKAATLSFCQPVKDSLTTLDAIKAAFSQLVFPLDPMCTENMQIGTIAKVSFDGAFNCELDVTYGLGDYKVSAPSLSSVQQSLQNVVKLKSPSVEVDAGAKGSITYAHTDHFALIANKTSETAAMLYLVRASEDDWGASVGITVGVTTTASSVTVDSNKLQSVVMDQIGNRTIATQVASAASEPINALQTSLNGKLKNWASDVTGEAGLTVGLSRQQGHTALFVFQVDLAKADLTRKSWAALVDGSVAQAMALQGFVLEPGSGVADSLKRASTIQFQFFNLFSFKQVTDYFSNAYTELGKDGTIRIFRDLGQEQSVTTKHALQQFRIYFVATATKSLTNKFSQAAVDLCLELSENGNSKYAAALANIVAFLPNSPAVNSARQSMMPFVSNASTGTLDLLMILKSSSYRKLTCSSYNKNKPAPLPQDQDKHNWDAFRAATEALDPNLNFVSSLNYEVWITFNRCCIDKCGSTMTPDRRQVGNVNAVPSSVYNHYGPPKLVQYFLQASAGFMNLCDDLNTLAAGVPNVQDSTQWNDLLKFLTSIVTEDVFMDYAKPTVGALLSLCSEEEVQVSSTLTKSKNGNSLTCTLTLT